jgi:hypothetical protein
MKRQRSPDKEEEEEPCFFDMLVDDMVPLVARALPTVRDYIAFCRVSRRVRALAYNVVDLVDMSHRPGQWSSFGAWERFALSEVEMVSLFPGVDRARFAAAIAETPAYKDLMTGWLREGDVMPARVCLAGGAARAVALEALRACAPSLPHHRPHAQLLATYGDLDVWINMAGEPLWDDSHRMPVRRLLVRAAEATGASRYDMSRANVTIGKRQFLPFYIDGHPHHPYCKNSGFTIGHRVFHCGHVVVNNTTPIACFDGTCVRFALDLATTTLLCTRSAAYSLITGKAWFVAGGGQCQARCIVKYINDPRVSPTERAAAHRRLLRSQRYVDRHHVVSWHTEACDAAINGANDCGCANFVSPMTRASLALMVNGYDPDAPAPSCQRPYGHMPVFEGEGHFQRIAKRLEAAIPSWVDLVSVLWRTIRLMQSTGLY